METDRYQQNHSLFILGLVSLLLSLSLLAFSCYNMPYLLFNWRYDVPEFIIMLHAWLVSTYSMTDHHASWVIVASLFSSSILFGIIAYIASNRIDNAIYDIKQEEHTTSIHLTKDFKASAELFGKILLLVLLVVLVAIGLDWYLDSM